MKKAIILGVMLAFVLTVTMVLPVYADDKGFDEFGYNWTARNFVGTYESWMMAKYGYSHDVAEGDGGIYAHDKIAMKWNAEWDRGNAENWANPPYGAWETNEWNGRIGRQWGGGKVAGSGEVWHYKIIWVGTELGESPYWSDGGYAIWGQFEVIMDQGSTADREHVIFAVATPNGFGGIK